MNTFTVYHQLTLKEYRKIVYRILYSKTWIIVIYAFAMLFIIYSCLMAATKNYRVFNSHFYSLGVGVAALAIWIPLSSWFSIRRSFKNTYRIHEPITYEFSDEGYSTTGESFNNKADWAKVYKIQIINEWLLIYQNRRVANMIKIDPENKNNIEALKQFLKAGTFKAKLKW